MNTTTAPRLVLHLLACAAAFATACSYPMGLSKQQWQSLSPEQQAQYQAQQHSLDVERRREFEAQQAEERRQAAAREEQERERIAAIARAPQPGDVITVHISGGQIAFFGRRAEYEPISFDLVRGEKRFVEFPLRGNPGSLSRVPVRFSEDGNTFYFDETALNRIVIINDGWRFGRTYRPAEIPLRDGWSQAAGISISIRHRHAQPSGLPRGWQERK